MPWRDDASLRQNGLERVVGFSVEGIQTWGILHVPRDHDPGKPAVWSQLDEELGDCTCFIVSHRLATIRRADRILVLEDGQLVDKGTHEDLAERCETYREFLRTERRKAQLKADASDGPLPAQAG